MKPQSTNSSQAGNDWRPARIGRPHSAQALREAEKEARSGSSTGWRKSAALTSRPSSASGHRRYAYGYEPSCDGTFIFTL